MAEFRAGVALDTTEAVNNLNELREKTDDAKTSISDFGNEGSRALNNVGEAAGEARSGFGHLHEIGERLKGLQLQQTFGAIRGALGDLGDVLGTNLDTGVVGRMLQLGSSFAEVGSMMGPQGALVGGIIGAAIPAFTSLVNWLEETERATQELEARNRTAAFRVFIRRAYHLAR